MAVCERPLTSSATAARVPLSMVQRYFQSPGNTTQSLRSPKRSWSGRVRDHGCESAASDLRSGRVCSRGGLQPCGWLAMLAAPLLPGQLPSGISPPKRVLVLRSASCSTLLIIATSSGQPLRQRLARGALSGCETRPPAFSVEALSRYSLRVYHATSTKVARKHIRWRACPLSQGVGRGIFWPYFSATGCISPYPRISHPRHAMQPPR